MTGGLRRDLALGLLLLPVAAIWLLPGHRLPLTRIPIGAKRISWTLPRTRRVGLASVAATGLNQR